MIHCGPWLPCDATPKLTGEVQMQDSAGDSSVFAFCNGFCQRKSALPALLFPGQHKVKRSAVVRTSRRRD